MNKETFLEVLQASLLAYDGVSVQELCSQYGISRKIALAGFNLTEYLRSIDIKEKVQ